MPRLCVIANEPIRDCYAKGEIKPRYYNPGDLFDEVHLLTLAADDISANVVPELAGSARLTIHPVGAFRLRNAIGWWRHRQRILELIRGIGPDLIRAHNPILAGWIAIHAGRRLGVPVVVSVHTDYDEAAAFLRRAVSWRAWLAARLMYSLTQRSSLRGADRVICVSQFLVRYARKYGARRGDVIYNKVDTSRFTPRPMPAGDTGPLTVLCVGRVGRLKNQTCLVRAVKGLDARLVLVGRPDSPGEHAELLDAIRRETAPGQVECVDAVPYARIPEVYRSADVFAIATTHEGLCTPVLEAMACGLPVVVPDVGPLPELVGTCGIVLAANEPGHFRLALEQLRRDSALRAELGRRARARALELDGAVMEEREAALYRELLRREPCAASAAS